MKDREAERIFNTLDDMITEVENIGRLLENVCERLDTQHATIVSVLLAILRKTGAELPPEVRNAHRPDDDDLFERAREAVIGAGKASTSYLQRRFGIGYSRAAWLIELLEERGVVGPANGAKPREVLDNTTRQRS